MVIVNYGFERESKRQYRIQLSGSLEYLHCSERGRCELIIEKAKKFMKDMYPVDTPDLLFLLVGLESSKQDMELKISGVLDESGIVEMEGMEGQN
ncbi:hypothetical protein Tco_0046443 [Tanacetum coccineum]